MLGLLYYVLLTSGYQHLTFPDITVPKLFFCYNTYENANQDKHCNDQLVSISFLQPYNLAHNSTFISTHVYIHTVLKFREILYTM